MRRLTALLSLLPLVVVVTLAQHGREPPEVQKDIQDMLSKFNQYVKYEGPKNDVPKKPKHGPEPAAGVTFWMENIKHQGIAPFNPSSGSYQVFRNVKDFGAKGDGVTDDTAAINNAISSGNRCAPGQCQSSTTTPAVVYFPAGTYIISSSIIDYYFTQIIGNPNSLPILRATPNFKGLGLIDSNPYQSTGNLGYGSTNVFYRQVRNLIFDMTDIPANLPATGIHWPTAQATSLQNCVFQMSDAAGTQHQGIFIESGSGGFINDLTFQGGLNGVTFGNQQFTVRNLSFSNCVTAINQIWDWGWTYKSIAINNCTTGVSMGNGGHDAQTVGSVTFFDSSISNTKVGFSTSHDATSQPPAGGSLIIENVQLNNVPVAVQGPNQTTALTGTTGQSTIAAWGQGHSYTPNGPTNFEGPITPNNRPGSLLQGNKYYERSKPQYEQNVASDFVSVRSAGALGDGNTDDIKALDKAIKDATKQGKIVFFDAGIYKITKTLRIPAGARIVGETYPVIMSSGKYFDDINDPKPVVQIGGEGDGGSIEWSDMIVGTQGAQAGAILIEFNLAAGGTPSGLWDVHTRIGGFAGSNLRVADCPTTPTVPTPPAPVKSSCIAAFMSMHITQGARGVYMENNWLWTADHDIDDPTDTQITVYAGRGLYIESEAGNIWLVGTAVEHHTFYQYQLANTRNLFMGQIQTETAYYQPNPNAATPFPVVKAYNDPDFVASCQGKTPNCLLGWGLRVINSQSVLVYGAGLYSFFNNYSTTCSNQGNGEACQLRIFSVEGYGSHDVNVYNLNTIGTTEMIDRDGVALARYSDNLDGFVDTIALFRSN